MSYAVIQTAVGAVVQKITGYDSTNVKEDDQRGLAIGTVKSVVVSRGGGNDESHLGMGTTAQIMNTWEVVVTLFVPFSTSRNQVAASINTEMQKIVNEVNKWPKLDGTANVVDAEIKRIGAPEPYAIDRGRWWVQDISVMVQEINAVALSE